VGFFKTPSTNSNILFGIAQDMLVQYGLELNDGHSQWVSATFRAVIVMAE
jgi:hypothetical protein